MQLHTLSQKIKKNYGCESLFQGACYAFERSSGPFKGIAGEVPLRHEPDSWDCGDTKCIPEPLIVIKRRCSSV